MHALGGGGGGQRHTTAGSNNIRIQEANLCGVDGQEASTGRCEEVVEGVMYGGTGNYVVLTI